MINSLFLCGMEKKTQTTDLSVLLSNKEYADAFHNYFYLLGNGKKSWATQYLKKMKEIEKNLVEQN